MSVSTEQRIMGQLHLSRATMSANPRTAEHRRKITYQITLLQRLREAQGKIAKKKIVEEFNPMHYILTLPLRDTHHEDEQTSNQCTD